GLASTGAEFVEHAADPHCLQPGKLERQRFAGGADIKQPLTAVGALLLDDVALVDKLLEDAAERLLGDFQNVEQLSDFHTRVAINEMQHAMVRAAKAELVQKLIGVADEVAVGKEQKLDEIPIGLARIGALGHRRGGPVFARRCQTDVGHYVSTIDIFRFGCYPQRRYVTATWRRVHSRRAVVRAPNGALIGQMRP